MSVKTFAFVQDGVEKRTSRSFFRGDSTNFFPSDTSLKSDDVIDTYVMKGWSPAEPFVTTQTPIVAFGSCFAANISNYLHGRGYNVLTKKENQAYVTQMGDGIVNVFAILQQFEWAWLNKTPQGDLWHGYRAEDFGYDDRVRADTKALFDNASLFIITLGLSEVWYDEPTGEVFWRAVPSDKYDPSRHKFRVATHAETLKALKSIHALIRQFRPDAAILFSVSPIPLTATFRSVSCITANAVSKSTLRSAFDEFHHDASKTDSKLFYFPSYEAVINLFNHQWHFDRRHVHSHVLDFNMKMFETYYCTPGLDAPELLQSFRDASRKDQEIGASADLEAGLTHNELREQVSSVKRTEARQARMEQRQIAREEEKEAIRRMRRQAREAERQAAFDKAHEASSLTATRRTIDAILPFGGYPGARRWIGVAVFVVVVLLALESIVRHLF